MSTYRQRRERRAWEREADRQATKIRRSANRLSEGLQKGYKRTTTIKYLRENVKDGRWQLHNLAGGDHPIKELVAVPPSQKIVDRLRGFVTEGQAMLDQGGSVTRADIREQNRQAAELPAVLVDTAREEVQRQLAIATSRLVAENTSGARAVRLAVQMLGLHIYAVQQALANLQQRPDQSGDYLIPIVAALLRRVEDGKSLYRRGKPPETPQVQWESFDTTLQDAERLGLRAQTALEAAAVVRASRGGQVGAPSPVVPALLLVSTVGALGFLGWALFHKREKQGV